MSSKPLHKSVFSGDHSVYLLTACWHLNLQFKESKPLKDSEKPEHSVCGISALKELTDAKGKGEQS